MLQQNLTTGNLWHELWLHCQLPLSARNRGCCAETSVLESVLFYHYDKCFVSVQVVREEGLICFGGTQGDCLPVVVCHSGGL